MIDHIAIDTTPRATGTGRRDLEGAARRLAVGAGAIGLAVALGAAACSEDEPDPTPGCRPAETALQRCRGTTVETCDGTGWVDVVDCAKSAEICRQLPGSGRAECTLDPSCLQEGASRCNETRIEECSSGLWVTATDCGRSHQICGPVAGSEGVFECVFETACSVQEAGLERCRGTVSEKCDGAAWAAIVDCAAQSKTCAAHGTRAVCQSRESCDGMGAQRCSGATIEECNGVSWFVAQDCADRGRVCQLVAGFDRIAECAVLRADCGSGDNGATRCNGAVVERCNGARWERVADCAEQGRPCRVAEDAPRRAGCFGAPYAELEPCTGAGQGDCQDNLQCATPDAYTQALCFAPCSPGAAPDSCGAGRRCVAASGASMGGVCMHTTAARDQGCGDDGRLCAAGADECTKTVSDPVTYHCKTPCDSQDIGRQGGCSTGELCLYSGWYRSQSPQQTCTRPGEVDVCDAGAGYFCETLSSGTRCIRHLGWCGTLVPMMGAFSPSEREAYFDAGHRCDKIGAHLMCGVPGSTPSYEAADVKCKDMGTDGQGQAKTACVGFCAPRSAGGADRGCGAGYGCGQPPADDAKYFSFEQDAGGQRVPCAAGDDTACDGPGGHRCEGPFSDGNRYCATPSRVCLSVP